MKFRLYPNDGWKGFGSPAIKAMLAAASRRELDLVLFWSLA